MTANGTELARLADVLALARDEAAVTAAFAPLAVRLFAGRAVEGVASWRIYALRRGAFLAGYRFRLAGAGPSPREVVALLLPGEEDRRALGAGAIAVPALSQVVLPFPRDPRLPRLADAIQGAVLGELGAGVRAPGEVVAYRPETRATLSFERDGEDPLWLRLSAEGRRFERTSRLARIAAALCGAPPLFPRVLAELGPASGVLLEHVPGRSLHDRIGDVGAAEIDCAGAALATLAAADPAGLPLHQALDEAEQTAFALRKAALLEPGRFAGVGLDLSRLFDAGSALEASRPAPIHRDLHDKQVLLDPELRRARFLDTDTLAAGDPALDLANLCAHFELRAWQGRLEPEAATALVGALRAACVQHGLSASPRRFAYFSACAFLRLAGVYQLRSHGVALVPQLLRRGRATLESLASPFGKELP